MQFVAAFDTLAAAEACAVRYFNNAQKQTLSDDSYAFYSGNAQFQIWVYRDEESESWFVIHCPPNSWIANLVNV